jgi:ATP-binding cassette subfamily B protein
MIYNKFKKKTMLIVAHRLATVKDCDKIIVMDKGKIAEYGTHEELLAAKGIYYRLWEMQQGNFINDKQTKETKKYTMSIENDDEDTLVYT